MNSRKHRLAIIGGDARQLIAASRLHALGYETVLYGFGEEEAEPHNSTVDSLCCSSCFAKPREILEDFSRFVVADIGEHAIGAEEALIGADAVILPLPASSDGNCVSMPLSGGKRLTFRELLSLMKKNGTKYLAAGKLNADILTQCADLDISVFDYYKSEEFAISNAIPTAEGAVEIAMRELPITLNGASALVIGYGRIGKVLSRLLKAIGTDVTVSARKPHDMAWIRALGCTPANTCELCDVLEKHFDIIFNTVPCTVLDKQMLAKLHKGTLIIDLASYPGGVDLSEAERRSLRVIWALSLPGKVAPVTSGEIIADTLQTWLLSLEGGG